MDGLEEVGRGDDFGPGEVGDGAGDLEDAIVGAGGKVELLHGLLQEVAERVVDGAVLARLPVTHAGVAGGGRTSEAGDLAVAGQAHAFADGGGGFALGGGAEFVDGEGGSLDVEVDAVEERTADAGAVALDLRRRAAALVAGVAEVAAGARIHGRDEHKAARQGDLAGATRDGDVAVFEGLAKDLQGAAFELGEFVEEEHAVVGEGDFAGAGDGAAAEEADVGDGVVGRAHGAVAERHGGIAQRLPGGGVDGEDFQGLLEGRRGHDRGDAFCDHAFTRARRTDHKEIVTASDGDLDGAAHGVLALDIGEVAESVMRGRGGGEGRGEGEIEGAGEETRGLVEGGDGVHGEAFDEGGLGGGLGRQEDALFAQAAGEAGEGEGAAHGAGGAGEAQLAGDHPVVEAGGGDLAGGDEDAEGDGEVVERAFFAQVAGGEVYGGARTRHGEAAVGDSGGDAIIGLLDGGIGQADQDEFGVAGFAGVDLDVDDFGVNALEGSGAEGGQHGDQEEAAVAILRIRSSSVGMAVK